MNEEGRIPQDDDEIARALRALPKERPVTQAQEAALAVRVAPPQTRRRWLRDLALAATVAAAAFLAGRTTALPPVGSSAGPEPNYMLLVHDDLPAPKDDAALHTEYARWAGSLARRGQLSGGEELAEDRLLLAAGAVRRESTRVSRSVAGGYFLLTARNEAEALAIARDCPHLRHGGTVELRAIVRR